MKNNNSPFLLLTKYLKVLTLLLLTVNSVNAQTNDSISVQEPQKSEMTNYDNSKDTIKILAIGNSFSQDALET